MAIKSGFYDSIEGDRTYNANDLNNIYAGVRSDGVVEGRLNDLKVVAGVGMSVDVTPGLAVILGKWFSNSSSYNLTLDAGGTLARIDGIYLKADNNERKIVPVVVKGAESSTPVKPEPSNNVDVKYLPIAYVTIPAGATSGGFTIEDARSYSNVNTSLTILWENKNPNVSIGQMKVTLSESIDNFEMIAVETTDGRISFGKKGQLLDHYLNNNVDKTLTNTFRYETRVVKRDYECVGSTFSFSNGIKLMLDFTRPIDGDGVINRVEGRMSDQVDYELKPFRVYGINRK